MPQAESHPSKCIDKRVGKSIECESTAWIEDEKTFAGPREGVASVQRDLSRLFGCKERATSRKPGKRNVSGIRQYEIEVSDSGWAKAIGSEDRHQFQSQLLYLRRPQYYARYGDYAERLSHRVIDHKFEGWEQLLGAQQWKNISERIKDENDEWQKRAITKKREAHPTTSAVMETCMAIGTAFP